MARDFDHIFAYDECYHFEHKSGKNTTDLLGQALPWLWKAIGDAKTSADNDHTLRIIEDLYITNIENLVMHSSPNFYLSCANKSGFRDGIRGKNEYLMLSLVDRCGEIGKGLVSNSYMMAFGLGRAVRELYTKKQNLEMM